MSKDNEKELKEKKTQEKKENSKENVVEKKDKEIKIEEKEVKKEAVKKEEASKKDSSKKEEKVEKKETKKTPKKEKVEVITEDSQIRKKVMTLGTYLLDKLKEYKYVIGLDIIVYLLLFFLIPKVVFDVKPIVWMTAFVIFTVLPTIGIYGMNKFRDKQIMFGFFFIYLLILLFINKFTIIELYGITSQGSLDHTPAWLDAVFITCIIVFFQYIAILIVNVVKMFKGNKKEQKSKK